MRLIDADALLENLKKTHRYFMLKADIDNAPTVEKSPQGKWISANGTYYCSCCKHYAYESQKFDFCQDCGADMRGKRLQGEWIGKEEYDDYPNKTVCECSECGKMICISHNDFPNFCFNCGAEMRGKEE